MKADDEGYRRYLPEYKDLSDEVFHRLTEKFSVDMDMFGYSYERDAKTGEVYATCVEKNCQ